jgi:hypothetical protein
VTTWAQTAIQWATSQALSLFGSTWQYRVLSSAYDAETDTFGTATNFSAQVVGQSQTQEYSETGHDYEKRQRAIIKCADTVSLKIGDQVIAPDGKHWHVLEVQDQNDVDGAKRYVIDRAVDLKGGDQARGGA